MKIIDGLKIKGAPAEIPDASRDDLPEFFKEMGYKVGAEIGVYKGDYTKGFLEAGLTMYAVDCWKPYKDFDIESENRIDRQEHLYRHTQKKLAQYGELVKFVRKTSHDALKNFEDNSLDFVYIDGNHSFKYVAEDICGWSDKVKSGGVVSGHDYTHPRRLGEHRWNSYQVKFVVDAYTEAFRINNWYVIGRKSELPGEKRDRFRSWFWIKP